ncbi:MAG TPA: class I SAM-dependent methyltransferase [Rhodocyclaceae bacterium]|nr:class I SAM-dependent methyltransferase [Rhodocyclaceae bacterium]
MQPINEYYDALARTYDQDRFGNSYGRYIDALERRILSAWLSGTSPARVLDVGCGTGRLLDFASTGVDSSREMLKLAAEKYPQHRLVLAASSALDVALDSLYDAAICFHVFMHFDAAQIAASFDSIARVVAPGGRVIVDIPSQHRRALGRRPPSKPGWHGNTAANRKDIERWAGANWRVVRRRGILFFPIHRIPSFARPLFSGLDALAGRTPLARYSSYHVYELQRC